MAGSAVGMPSVLPGSLAALAHDGGTFLTFISEPAS